jgi:hypothetical protein
MPSAAARKCYLNVKEPELVGEELEQFVALSDGFSIAHLRELIILAKCFNRPLDEAAKQLRGMRQVRPASDRAPDKAGFGFLEAA